jgi:hypothetical protein
MKHQRALGILILSDFILTILSIVSEFALEPFLPASLRAYLATDKAAAFRFGDAIMTSLWIVVAIATVLAWIGMLNMLRAARSLYLGSWVGNFIWLLLEGQVVGPSVTYVIVNISAIVGGAILWIVYFSELRTEFRRLSEVVGAYNSR